MGRLVEACRSRARDHPWSVDVALGVLLGGCGIVSTVLTDRLATASEQPFATGWSLAASVAFGLAVGLRRAFPLAVLAATSMLYAWAYHADATEGIFASVAVFVAFYTAGAAGSRPRAHWVRGASIALMAALLAWSVLNEFDGSELGEPERLSLQLLVVMLNVFYFAAAWVMGDLAHARRRREVLLEAQAAELAAAQAAIARQAVGAERMRIARELHDVVAHHVSVMGVQAGAARHILDRSPERASVALAGIEASSREAVAELQSLLGFLRQDGDLDTTAPPPTLDHLAGLVDQIEQAGVTVALDAEGIDGSLPAGLDLSAYRVVQEGLTNVVKHAGPGAEARVRVHQTAEALEVVVTDDGHRDHRGPTAPAPGRANGTGNGLVGMRERVALHGGELTAGARRGGGFEVRVVFPRPPGAGP